MNGWLWSGRGGGGVHSSAQLVLCFWRRDNILEKREQRVLCSRRLDSIFENSKIHSILKKVKNKKTPRGSPCITILSYGIYSRESITKYDDTLDPRLERERRITMHSTLCDAPTHISVGLRLDVMVPGPRCWSLDI